MEFLNDVNRATWLLDVGIQVLIGITCLIWALMLMGAWASSTKRSLPLLRHIALKDPQAKPIMKAMRRELVTLVIAISALVGAGIRSHSTHETLEAVIANLICQVRGENTPDGVAASLRAFSDIPNRLSHTVRAYNAFLEQPSTPRIDFLKSLLQKDHNTYDLRLLGIAHDIFAEYLPRRDPEKKMSYFHQALNYYEQAIALSNSELPGGPDVKLGHDFRAALHSNLAGVHLSLAELTRNDPPKRRDHLLKARTIYTEVKNSYGNRPAMFLNLAGVLSQLGEEDPAWFEEAISVLQEVPAAPQLSDRDKDKIKTDASNLKKMHELQPLAQYVLLKKKMPWAAFINQIWRGAPTSR